MNEQDEHSLQHEPYRAPPPRALGVNPTLRRISVLLWASFLGAVALTAALALLPGGCSLPAESHADQALFFALLWALSLISASVAGVLLDTGRVSA